MSTPAVSSASIFQELQSFYQNRQADLKQLGSDLKSGNLSAAQQDFQALAVLGEGGPFANSEPFSKSSRVQAFNTLGEALQAGDLGRAQTAFAALGGGQNNTTVSTPATVLNLASTQPSTTSPTTTTGTASIYQQLQAFRQQRTADLAQLGQDLQAGDLTAAQHDFNTLTALGQTGPANNGQPFQQTGRAQDFQAIGQALQNGDLGGAQTAFTALAGTFGSQNQQAQNAISAYNSGVTEIIINLNLVSPPVSTGTVPPNSVPAPPLGPPVPGGTGSTLPPPPVHVTSPPVFKPPLPIGPVAHPVSPGAFSSGTRSAGVPEIVINLEAASGANAAGGSTSTPPELVINIDQANNSSSGASEIVLNLGQGNGSSTASGEELTINLGSGSTGAQIIIEGAQGQNGSSAEPVTINLNPQSNYELILNLLNSSSTSSSNGLSVSA